MNGENTEDTLHVYHRNHEIRQGTCAVKAVLDLIFKFKETGCTCDRPQFGRFSVPLETVAEVHQTITTVRPARACSVSRVLHLLNSTVRKILCFVLNIFSYQCQRVQMFEEETINYS